MFVCCCGSEKAYLCISLSTHSKNKQTIIGTATAPVLASQAEAIVDLGRTWPQHRIDIH